MSEPQRLREALRTREALAPDPDAMLAGARGRIRRRRARRRVAGVVAAVAVVIAGVGTGMTVLRPGGQPESIEAAAGAADVPIPAPALPFTVGDVPPGFTLANWSVFGTWATAYYEWRAGPRLEQLSVTVMTTEPGTQEAPPLPPSRLPVGDDGSGEVLRAPESGRVIRVSSTRAVLPEERQAIADSVRLVPSPVPSPLRALRAPAGLTVRNRSGSIRMDSLTLCPAEVPDQSSTRDGRCYFVMAAETVGTPATTFTSLPAVPVKSARRQLDQDTELTVQTESGSQAVVDAIAASAAAR
ncbi:hypothetical protein [Amycolatopsis viridis]|uniref:Uncharacterized protein n=1 Tax=Amycolatopsis viridis TaxID=185678 RepID=A0ABX0SXD8_9PSEU|nr:hypothetical protein [Amycolatopsis viridis]NIH81612.1 hypothetical protein [Amycolatopsis viridis]